MRARPMQGSVSHQEPGCRMEDGECLLLFVLFHTVLMEVSSSYGNIR
jgi:hypothetical protein